MLEVIYPLVERMTKNQELLLFRNTFALVGRKGIKEWSGLAIDSHLKQFSFFLGAYLHVYKTNPPSGFYFASVIRLQNKRAKGNQPDV
jgi:hypothetical protein